MSIKIPNRHKVFVVLYFITMLALLLDQANALPMAGMLRKIKYLYIIIMLCICLGNGKVRKKCGIAFVVIGLLFLHTILFGFVFTNPIVAEATSDHVTQMLIFLCMVTVTYIYIIQNSAFSIFIDVSYVVTGMQLLILSLLHPRDFVNPFWGLRQAFAGGIRYKTTFGFVHAGYLSNACYLVLVLSLLFYEFNKNKNGERKKKFLLLISFFDGLAVLMIISAAERSGILAAGMAVGIYLGLTKCRFFSRKPLKIISLFAIVVGIIITLESGLWTHIWENSNRSLNITVNYPIFKQIGNFWTGMGFVESSGFHKTQSVFGVTTSSLDMYYVYIFFTTGVIGCFIMGLALLIIAYKLKNGVKGSFRNAMIGIYISMLFFAFWQCNLITYRYISPYILMVVLLSAITYECQVTSRKRIDSE